MLKYFRFPAIWAVLTFYSLPSFSQAPPVTRERPAICTDTMGHILTTETNSMLGVDYITKTRDGNILAPGYQWSVTAPFYTFPYLVKYTPQGTILWSKSFAGLGIYPQNNAYAYKCFELNDGSLLLVGLLSIPEKVNGRYEMAMWRLDANGNMIWVQTDSCSIWAQYSGSLEVVDLQQDPAGNIYLAGNQRTVDATISGSFALKMDLAGNIQWDKTFTSGLSSCFGMIWTGAQLAIVGSGFDGTNTEFLWCLTIDPATGDTLRSKTWVQDYGAGTTWYSFSSVGSARLLANGNISVCGPPLSDFAQTTTPLIHGVIAEFDPSFNYLRGWMIRSNIRSNYSNTRITEHPSGRISYTYLKYISANDLDIFYGAVEQGQIAKESVLHQQNRSDTWTSNFVNVAGNEDVVIQSYGDPVNNVSGQEFVRLHDSDTSSVCSGIDTLASWVEPFAMRPYRGSDWGSIVSNTFRRTDRPMPPPVDGNPVQQLACASTSFCRSLQLAVDQDSVCPGSPVVFTALRNTGCGGRPLWFFDTTDVQSYQLLNDTAIRIIYRNDHQGDITAAMTGTCSNLSASAPLTVTTATRHVSLGGDHYLCSDTVLVLRPAKGYSSYLWQDGSVADTLAVTKPGVYTVTVTNGCGTSSSDEVSVNQCSFHIYFPNAFRPDGNGTNSLFRAHSFGNISHYQLQVFNRWGQMVFATEDCFGGWDGRVNNIAQPAGTYIWVSRYQFVDEPEKTERGTLILIR
ncbi:T9SS type B sorting domain-containing protein [Puia dinghuensis]|uniref:Gliding motility-associated C-terminal domain-containing protein n=1 Tax=Puia dinghuensis TaxID=1792502 RepID=A0A8J2UI01_9BACT|nr:gliding motility-associated C-terminal domain-containing protein [Puia dinghuensis]GGB20165.1 hypothetical protein GCM10011511_49880 [Puia dinghuensis]